MQQQWSSEGHQMIVVVKCSGTSPHATQHVLHLLKTRLKGKHLVVKLTVVKTDGDTRVS